MSGRLTYCWWSGRLEAARRGEWVALHRLKQGSEGRQPRQDGMTRKWESPSTRFGTGPIGLGRSPRIAVVTVVVIRVTCYSSKTLLPFAAIL